MSREITSDNITKSYDGKHELQRIETAKGHYYKLDGNRTVSVTTFCKAAMRTPQGLQNWGKDNSGNYVFDALTVPSDNGYIPREGFYPIGEETRTQLVKDGRKAGEEGAQKAADIGTLCHSFAELHSAGKVDEANALLEKVRSAEKWPLIRLCVDKYLDWAATNKGKLILAETCVASAKYLFTGTFDRLDEINGQLVIRDYKTSKAIYSDMYLQLASYIIAIKEFLNLDVKAMEVLCFSKEEEEEEEGKKFDHLLIDDPKEVKMFTDQAIRCRYTYEHLKIDRDPRFDWKIRAR